MEVAQHTVELIKKSQDQKLYAEALYWNAYNLMGIDQYDAAIEQFLLAQKAFLQVSGWNCAADALFWIGYIPVYTVYGLNNQDIKDALAEFQSLPDPAGMVMCQVALAHEWDAQSIQTLTSTWEFCISHNLPREQAGCTQCLARVCINFGRFEEAKKWGLIALEETKQSNIWTFHVLNIIGNHGSALISLGDYDQAVEYLMKGLESNKAYGRPLGIIWILFPLGRAWMKKGQKEDARGAFMETLKYGEMLQGAW
ncbi:hypothetical protein BDP27DRAFT_1420463 [Rhodocollybia butyracea]|uniref:Uncharacterized protein n=1 Tax=Rhodocollybia butyracea TaxID=206335 RepID=A0A9P5PU41_9AGAR|nr:hypothetical protein BDP27DRAFT_1420463 [Rhodocollybia butyracea]